MKKLNQFLVRDGVLCLHYGMVMYRAVCLIRSRCFNLRKQCETTYNIM